ncbi:MAG: ABC transporter substrate-binding protein [Deltaproteobacteria bacterium]|nr:ABC transporter substrate-binding protein [Deltaproteobacteria bacterium]
MTKGFILIVMCAFIIIGIAGYAEGSGKPIRIAYLQSDIHHLACWISLEKGFFKDAGLDVEVAGIFKAGPEMMSAFGAGALDMGYVGQAPATTAVANGAVAVTVLAQVNTEGSAIVVRRNSPAKCLLSLVEKIVAIPGHSTVQDFLLQHGLAKSSVNANKVKTIVLKPPEMIGALRTGQIDAFIAWEPYPALAQSMAVGRVLISSSEIWEAHPCCVLVADNRFLSNHPDEAAAMVRCHIKATDFINEHPGKAAEIAMKYTGMDQRTVRIAMKNVHYDYEINIEGEKTYVDFLSKLGYIRLDDSNQFIKRFINGDFLRNSIKR